MDYNEYLGLLINNVSNKPTQHQWAVLKEIMRVDRWIELEADFKGWAVNLYDGIIVFLLENENSGKIYWEWDLNIKKEDELPANLKEVFEKLGEFKTPPEFEIVKKK